MTKVYALLLSCNLSFKDKSLGLSSLCRELQTILLFGAGLLFKDASKAEESFRCLGSLFPTLFLALVVLDEELDNALLANSLRSLNETLAQHALVINLLSQRHSEIILDEWE